VGCCSKKEYDRYNVEIALIVIFAIMKVVISIAVCNHQTCQMKKNEKRNITTSYLIEVKNLEPGLFRVAGIQCTDTTQVLCINHDFVIGCMTAKSWPLLSRTGLHFPYLHSFFRYYLSSLGRYFSKTACRQQKEFYTSIIAGNSPYFRCEKYIRLNSNYLSMP